MQTFNYSTTTTTNLTGIPPTTSTVANTLSQKYLGHEMVTTPAGTFETCKFEYTTGGGMHDLGSGGYSRADQVVHESERRIPTVTLLLNSGTINGSPMAVGQSEGAAKAAS